MYSILLLEQHCTTKDLGSLRPKELTLAAVTERQYAHDVLLVKKETIRADLAYNMGVKPEDISDDVVEMLFIDGYDNRFGFANGGGVGSLFKRKVA